MSKNLATFYLNSGAMIQVACDDINVGVVKNNTETAIRDYTIIIIGASNTNKIKFIKTQDISAITLDVFNNQVNNCKLGY